MVSLQALKQRFEIIGNSLGLNRALEKAMQVAPTDISVLITGESGVGKEVIPKIAHQLSPHRSQGPLPEPPLQVRLPVVGYSWWLVVPASAAGRLPAGGRVQCPRQIPQTFLVAPLGA